MSKSAALRHVRNCLRSSGWPAGIYPSSVIRIQDRHNPACWLAVLARHNARLSDLDCLIRDVWTECCSHPGAFTTIGKETCMNTGDGMAAALTDLLRPGSSFTCDYDSDSPTALELKILDTTPVMPPEGLLCLIAQTTRPSYSCGISGKETDHDRIDGEEGSTPDDLLQGSVNAPGAGNIRNTMILTRCEEFCTRFEDDMIAKHCRKIVRDLAAHLKTPLSRGDDILWSAAIVYSACRDEGLIGRAKGGSPLARDIGEFFDLELPSVRNKVTALKKYIAECEE
ncbi:DUF6398 domain-containing protein [Methanogenium sp. MK-MG]|uniref:DUF6398 domain-containing protein n=1 Tax=Methanogenium sp. MK-MG TaxID=2599926 RepID=UPI0013EC7273|nr:DUF6398 domain-containing protein [Methanogenium sp. MK-MG]